MGLCTHTLECSWSEKTQILLIWLNLKIKAMTLKWVLYAARQLHYVPLVHLPFSSPWQLFYAFSFLLNSHPLLPNLHALLMTIRMCIENTDASGENFHRISLLCWPTYQRLYQRNTARYSIAILSRLQSKPNLFTCALGPISCPLLKDIKGSCSPCSRHSHQFLTLYWSIR